MRARAHLCTLVQLSLHLSLAGLTHSNVLIPPYSCIGISIHDKYIEMKLKHMESFKYNNKYGNTARDFAISNDGWQEFSNLCVNYIYLYLSVCVCLAMRCKCKRA